MHLTHSYTYPFYHLSISSFTHPSIYPATHSPPITHPLTGWSSVHPSTHSIFQISIDPSTQSFTINSSTNPFFRSPKHAHSTIHPAIHALIHPLTPSSIFPVIHSPVHARMHLLNHLSQTTYSFETTAFVSNVATVLSWIAIMISRLE